MAHTTSTVIKAKMAGPYASAQRSSVKDTTSIAIAVRAQDIEVRSGCRPGSSCACSGACEGSNLPERGIYTATITAVTANATKTMKDNTGIIAGTGRGRSVRIARSTCTQRTAAPPEIHRPPRITRTATAVW